MFRAHAGRIGSLVRTCLAPGLLTPGLLTLGLLTLGPPIGPAPALAQELPGHRTAVPTAETEGMSEAGKVAKDAVDAKSGAQVVSLPGAAGAHSTIEIVFSVAVLAWGMALMLLLTWVMIRSGQYWNAAYLRLCVLGIVVTAGLFVIVAGYTEHQIGPMMGLLGTLVGYLLGKGSDGNKDAREGEGKGGDDG